MGYTTDFDGEFTFDRPLTAAHAAYLRRFAATRRMKRNADVAATLSDPIRLAVGLPVGVDGGYYVGEDDGDFGQRGDGSIVNYNQPPAGQPGLWCQWTVADDDAAIVWDGGEKFYRYVDWLRYLIEHFIKPWGYTLNGEVKWAGEDRDDNGLITVTDNVVKVTRLVLMPEK